MLAHLKTVAARIWEDLAGFWIYSLFNAAFLCGMYFGWVYNGKFILLMSALSFAYTFKDTCRYFARLFSIEERPDPDAWLLKRSADAKDSDRGVG